MPAATAPAEATAATQSAGKSSTLFSILRAIAIFVAFQLVVNNFLGGGKKSQDKDGAAVVKTSSGSQAIPLFEQRPESLEPGAVYNPIPQNLAPIWYPNGPVDLKIVVSSSFNPEPVASTPRDNIVLDEKSFRLDDLEDRRSVDTEFSVPKEVQKNGTLWGHFYVGLPGANLDPTVSGFDTAKAVHFIHPLTQYIAQKKVKKTKNLLAAKSSDDILPEEDTTTTPSGPIIKSHYHPNFTLSFIPSAGVMTPSTMHPALSQYIHVESSGARDATGQNGWYYPILYINTFWQLKTHMIVLNETVQRLPMHIDLGNLAYWKFSIMSSMDEGAKQTAKNAAHGIANTGGGDGSEMEMIKEVLLDTNIYLLGTTVVVSILHMGFEMMAFKSDISHYRNKKNNVGISVRSILANVFMQGIIFLYLLDNNETTSWMILLTQGMGIVLELWKITTVVNVRLRPSSTSPLGYRLAFEDKHVLSETEARTKEYDQIAFKYMYLIAIPLLLAYAVYSLMYQTHKSWYSFVIATLVGSVYAYGFLMMVPSLYINYRLKSVAHMPGRAMMYKFLNTFIDDLFAFTIKMPLLHRLATLRDDVIFFVYLYQSYKYKIDYKRVNEFGQGGDEEELEEKVANRPLSSIPGADTDAGREVVREGIEKAKGGLEEVAAVATGNETKAKATKRR